MKRCFVIIVPLKYNFRAFLQLGYLKISVLILDDQDQFPASKLRRNDAALQTATHLHQVCCDPKPFWEVNQFHPGLWNSKTQQCVCSDLFSLHRTLEKDPWGGGC